MNLNVAFLRFLRPMFDDCVGGAPPPLEPLVYFELFTKLLQAGKFNCCVCVLVFKRFSEIFASRMFTFHLKTI